MGVVLLLIIVLTYCQKGVNCFSLVSSPPSSEDGHVTVCPGTNITLTCSATSVHSLAWRYPNGFTSFITSDPVSKVVVQGPYTMTLVDKDSDLMGTNFTSTLEVNVDSISNDTNISCEIFRNQRSFVIYSHNKPHFSTTSCGPPIPPANGSVRGWTSSQVGAQVIYICHDDLVLNGNSIAICSSALKWTPSREDVMCIRPSALTPLPSYATNITLAASSLPPTTHSHIIVIIAVIPSLVVGAGIVLIVVVSLIHCLRKYKSTRMKREKSQQNHTLTLSTTNSHVPFMTQTSENDTAGGYCVLELIHGAPRANDKATSCSTYETIEPSRKLLPCDSHDNLGTFICELSKPCSPHLETHPSNEETGKEICSKVESGQVEKPSENSGKPSFRESAPYSSTPKNSPLIISGHSCVHSSIQPLVGNKHPQDVDCPLVKEYEENEMASSPPPPLPPPLAPEDIL